MTYLDIFWNLITSYDIGDRRWDPFWPLILLAIPLSVCQEFRLIRPWSMKEISWMPPPRCPSVPGPSSKSSSAAGGVGGLQEVSFAWSNWLNNISTSSHLTERGWFSRESFQKLSDTSDWWNPKSFRKTQSCWTWPSWIHTIHKIIFQKGK